MSSKVKIGIIGAGYIAAVHAGVLARDERVQLAAITDVLPQKAVLLASTHNAAVATTLKCWKGVTVFVTTPNTQHVSLAIAAVGTGKHVFCEKPLATNVADAHRVFEASQNDRRSRPTMV